MMSRASLVRYSCPRRVKPIFSMTQWDSKIELSEKFFHEIIRHPVPLDMNTLTALKWSSLGLDLYLWLTYRTFTLRFGRLDIISSARSF